MRALRMAILGGFFCVNVFAQSGPPAVRIGAPLPVNAPLPSAGAPLPPPIPGELPPSPPPSFNVGPPIGGPVISQPVGPQPYFPPPTIVQQSPPTSPLNRLWGSFDYLLWYSKGDKLPPLVAALNAGGLRALSDETANEGAQSGFRGTAGIWFDLNRTYGIEASYLWFVRNADYQGFPDVPGESLVRPFVDANTGRASFLQLSSATGTARGFARVINSFDSDGWEVNALFRAPAMFSEEVHLLAGVRSFGLKERLGVEGITFDPSADVAVSNYDEFRTRNRFYGVQVGARWNYTGERWTFDMTGKFAIGGVGQEAVLTGVSSRSTTATNTLATGGLLVQPSNAGDYDRTRFAIMPEVAANLGYRVTSFATLFIGYNFLYMNNALRPGRQIDYTVNPTQMPFSAMPPTNRARPMYQASTEGFWLQGINFGIALRF